MDAGSRLEGKRCTKCGQPGNFAKRTKAADGLNPWCKACVKRSADAYYYRNRDSVLEAQKARNRTMRDALNAYQKEWYRRNKQKHIAKTRAYTDAHRELYKRWRREWADANPDRQRANNAASSHRRRSRIAASDNTLTRHDIVSAIEMSCGLCAYCLLPYSKPTVEHVIPISKGGANAAYNIVIACAKCNRAKAARGPLAMVNACSR